MTEATETKKDPTLEAIEAYRDVLRKTPDNGEPLQIHRKHLAAMVNEITDGRRKAAQPLPPQSVHGLLETIAQQTGAANSALLELLVRLGQQVAWLTGEVDVLGKKLSLTPATESTTNPTTEHACGEAEAEAEPVSKEIVEALAQA